VKLYRYFVTQSSEFCRHNPLCCFSTSVFCCCLFRYRLSPETFGYTFVWLSVFLLLLNIVCFSLLSLSLFAKLDKNYHHLRIFNCWTRSAIEPWWLSRYRAGLRAGRSGFLKVRFPAEAGNLFLHHRVQNGSGAHPASYPMRTRGSFPGGKAAGAWSWPLTSI
jgi:hypothetical protein